jgi:hypothetical protein
MPSLGCLFHRQVGQEEITAPPGRACAAQHTLPFAVKAGTDPDAVR